MRKKNLFRSLVFTFSLLLLISCEKAGSDGIITDYENGFIEFTVKGIYNEHNIDYTNTFSSFIGYQSSLLIDYQSFYGVHLFRESEDNLGGNIDLYFKLDTVDFELLGENLDVAYVVYYPVDASTYLCVSGSEAEITNVHFKPANNYVTGEFFKEVSSSTADENINYTIKGKFQMYLYKEVK